MIGPEDALELVSRVDRIVVSKGKRVVEIDLRQAQPDRKTLLKLLLGPSGNLRAPSLIKGRTLLVGFDEGSYSRALL